MIPKTLRNLCAFLLTASLATPSFAASSLPKVELVRTVKQSEKFNTKLSRDIYRTETYQANYTVQVPYQDQETYYEEVPYQERETYTEYEDYYVKEQFCENRTRNEEICETIRKCEPIFERRCEKRKICQIHLPGALNALLMVYQMSQAHADPDDEERQKRERENNERQAREREAKERENNERQARERENREREANERQARERERENREREANEREANERQAREREQRERQSKEREANERQALEREREAKEREANERQAKEREANERQAREREAKEREQRERQAKEKEANERQSKERQAKEREANERQAKEKEAREREERERQAKEREQRENNEKQAKERQEREKREREERENDGKNREEREKREREERENREREERERREHERCNIERCEKVKVGEDCKDERKCRTVPKTERYCEERSVRKTRPVTKERWVTKYRSERRTRTVTRYRDEVRCCVTKERQVLDHRISADVEVLFPKLAQLIDLERESFMLEITESGVDTQLSITPQSVIYTYSPKIQKISNTQFVVQMDLVPSYAPGDLGEATISDLTLVSLGNRLRFSFADKGAVAKTLTDYRLTLIDATGAQLVVDQISDQKQTRVKWDLNLNLPVGQPVRARLEVMREGVVISAPVSFVMERDLAVSPEDKYDVRPYMDKNLVGKFSIVRNNTDLIINFRDMTADIPQVKTEYVFKLVADGKVLAEKTFCARILKSLRERKLPYQQ